MPGFADGVVFALLPRGFCRFERMGRDVVLCSCCMLWDALVGVEVGSFVPLGSMFVV